MHRRLSSLVGSGSKSVGSTPYDVGENESKVSTVMQEPESIMEPPSLKIKRVDWYYSRWTKSWKYRNTTGKAPAEPVPAVLKSGENDPWKDFMFVVVRTVPRSENERPSFKMVIKSGYILQICKDVIQSWPGISWNADPVELHPDVFIPFYEQFLDYRDELIAKKNRSDFEDHLLASVKVLLSYIETDYKHTLSTIDKLKSHREITSAHLYAILVPRTLFVTRCAITGQPRIFKLTAYTRTSFDELSTYVLECEGVDFIDRASSQTVVIGRVRQTIKLNYFKGTIPMEQLDAYPLRYHPNPDALKATVIERGKKWATLQGMHHKQFDGIAAMRYIDDGKALFLRHNVRGRIMIDRPKFRKMNSDYKSASPATTESKSRRHHRSRTTDSDNVQANPAVANGTIVAQNTKEEDPIESTELTDEDYLLAPTVVSGFSLSDKLWLEFDVTKIKDVVWNNEAFANLVLPNNLKDLLQSLVEAHHNELGFDDFIRGKGQGLVINLFGPPGVGKTFSAEATSEHVKRPLYIVGAGDLGTDPAKLDSTLESVFELATVWKAIVLIDEADVFMEQRSLHDLDRNAMVAVFLRHIEYYRGILFLTTNRVKAFDEAFLSRIHVALHFHELPVEARAQVWRAFMAKLGVAGEVTEQQISLLAEKQVNGRQIKNAARTAQSLAVGRREKLELRHFLQTLEAMDSFTKEFDKLRAN